MLQGVCDIVQRAHRCPPAADACAPATVPRGSLLGLRSAARRRCPHPAASRTANSRRHPTPGPSAVADLDRRKRSNRHHAVRPRIHQRPSTPACRSHAACRWATGPTRSAAKMGSSASPTAHADDRLDHSSNHGRRAARRKAQPRPVAQIDDHPPMTIRPTASTACHLYQNEACHATSRAGSCTAGDQRANGRARADTHPRRWLASSSHIALRWMPYLSVLTNHYAWPFSHDLRDAVRCPSPPASAYPVR